MCLVGKNVKRSGIPAEKVDGIVDIAGGGSSAQDLRIMVATAGMVGTVTLVAVATADTMATPTMAIPTAIMVDTHPSASTELTEKTAGRCG